MIRFLADENFDHHIVQGLLRRNPGLDLVRAQDEGLVGVNDVFLLEWCARAGRVLLTHDANTIVRFAYDRIRAGQRMSGVLELRQSLPAQVAIEEILIIAECSHEGEWEGQVRYLPLR
jgi:hypothetical protein